METNVSDVSITSYVLFTLRQQSPDIQPLLTGPYGAQKIRPCGVAIKAQRSLLEYLID